MTAHAPPAVLTSPAAYEANAGVFSGRAPRGTTTVRVLVDGRRLHRVALRPGHTRFSFGPTGLPPRDVTITVRFLRGGKLLGRRVVRPVFGLPAASWRVVRPHRTDARAQRALRGNSAGGAISAVGSRDRAGSSPALDGDRLIGRGAYDMKGALAALLLALADLRDQDAVRVRLGVVPGRGVRGGGRPRRRPARRRGLPRRLRDHRRADRHARRRGRQGRARDADPRSTGARPTAPRRGWARTRSCARSTCSAQIQSLPFALAELGAVRPAVDQPRPHPGRRRAEQGARHLLSSTSTCATCPSRTRRDPRRGSRAPGRDGRSRPSAARRRWSTPSSPFVRALCARGAPRTTTAR